MKCTVTVKTAVIIGFVQYQHSPVQPALQKLDKDHFLFGNYGLSKPSFLHCFMLWLAPFANQHTKSIENHKHFRLIALKQVKIDMSCRNEKNLWN